MSHPVREAVESDLKKFPEELQVSAWAAVALTMADVLDDKSNSATSRSMCAKVLIDTMEKLRGLAGHEEEEDGLDELSSRRAARSAAT